MFDDVTLETISAAATALVGVVIFALASRLPSPFPAWVTRAVAFFAICAALLSLWFSSENWWIVGALGGLCAAVIAAVDIAETRRRRKP